MLRRITTCVLLLALAGIYAAPLAAAFTRDGMDCCAAGMCPHTGHTKSHHTSHQNMPHCAMDSHSGSTPIYGMCSCEPRPGVAVHFGVFVLSAPAGIQHIAIHSPVLQIASEVARPISQIPETPPPRTSLS